MIINHSQQNIIIDLPASVKNIGLKISGGADSAIVAYILSKYIYEERPDIKITPITVVHEEKPYQEIFSKNIINFLKDTFGNIFNEHIIAYATRENYIQTQVELLNNLLSNGDINIQCSGICKAPPPDEFQVRDGDGPADDRYTVRSNTLVDNLYMRMLINIDKKGIAELYQQFGLLETLFPLTRSCEEITTNFSTHCGYCWWCRERSWGFSRLI